MLGGLAAVLRRAAGRTLVAERIHCYGLARRLAHASHALVCMDRAMERHGRSSRKRARQACGPL
eukprot:721723-Prymnesium_polylepis.1